MVALSRFTIELLTRLQRPGFRSLDGAWLDRVGRDLDGGMKDAILALYRSANPDVLGAAGANLGRLACRALILWGSRTPMSRSRRPGSSRIPSAVRPKSAPSPAATGWGRTGRRCSTTSPPGWSPPAEPARVGAPVRSGGGQAGAPAFTRSGPAGEVAPAKLISPMAV